MHLPLVNAVLNTVSAVCLLAGFVAIRRGKRDVHMRFMISALVASALFLVSYLTHKFLYGTTYYGREGAIRVVYLVILGTHTILAAVNVPLVVVTVVHAAKGRFDRHKRWARWTLPIWFYVSVTGVVVYLMLRPYY
jgi:putative membrane protein